MLEGEIPFLPGNSIPVAREADSDATQPPIDAEQAALRDGLAERSLSVGAVLDGEFAATDDADGDEGEADFYPGNEDNLDSPDPETEPTEGGAGGGEPPEDTIRASGNFEDDDRDGEFGGDDEEYEETIAAEPNEVVVERRIVDGIPVTAALSTQQIEDTPQIAVAVGTCDILVVYAGICDDEVERARQEQACNLLTSSEASPEQVEDAMGTAIQNDFFALTLASQLSETNAKVRVFSLNATDPEASAIVAHGEARNEATTLVADLAPPSKIRSAAYEYAETGAAVTQAVNRKLAQEMPKAIEEAKQLGDASVGVVVPYGACPIVEAMGERAPNAPVASATERVAQTDWAFNQARTAAAEGDLEQAAVFIERGILVSFMCLGTERGVAGIHTSEVSMAMERYVSGLSDRTIRNALTSLEEELTDRSLERNGRQNVVRRFAAPFLAEMVQLGFLE
ncbi:MAG TPA: hypothetical protein VLF60_01115 [Candidatus Saccharimonadales bacterium]|nr:hypothetical protein [Candidatus Saccharimonadales bacterium]